MNLRAFGQWIRRHPRWFGLLLFAVYGAALSLMMLRGPFDLGRERTEAYVQAVMEWPGGPLPPLPVNAIREPVSAVLERDPFQPLTPDRPSVSTKANALSPRSRPDLATIRFIRTHWDLDQPVAIGRVRNGDLYRLRIGDYVGDDVIAAIRQDGVVLRSSTGERVLSVDPKTEEHQSEAQ